MAKRDYYEVLGVDRQISEANLKKAYRRLAMKHHPDRNKDDSAADGKFQEIQEAYGVLSDPEKRSLYDRFGHEAVGVAGASGASTAGGFEDVFGDMFGDIFGRSGRGGRTESRGTDLAYRMELDLEEAVFGVTREIDVDLATQCSTLQRFRLRAGHSAGDLSELSGPRGSGRSARPFQIAPDLSEMPRGGAHHPCALSRLPWCGAGAQDAYAAGQDSIGSGSGRSGTLGWRG